MKIYVCYKFSWIDKKIVMEELYGIKKVLDNYNLENFIFNIEYIQDEFDADFVATKMKEKISESDLILTYINYPQKSEWMLMEQGIAHALGKKITVFVKNNVKSNYFLTYGTNADIIEYNDYNDFLQKLEKYLILNLWRQKIDNIDNQILNLLNQRFKEVEKIWKYKKQNWLPALDQKRRDELIQQKIKKWQQLWLDEWFIKNIWDTIHQQALKNEEQI